MYEYGSDERRIHYRVIKKNKTYEDISDILRRSFPGLKGFSVTSIKRFCMKNRISTRVLKEYLGEVVSKAVDEVTLLRLLICLFHVFICNWKKDIQHFKHYWTEHFLFYASSQVI